MPDLPVYRGSRRIGEVLLSLVGIPLLLILLASQLKPDYFASKPAPVGQDGVPTGGTSSFLTTNAIGYLPLPSPPSVDLTPRIPTVQRESAIDAAPRPERPRYRQVTTKLRPPSRPIPARTYSTRMVVVRKQETLFQLAMENYGKSNWEIIGQIRARNPGIRDSFAYIHQGQRVILPNLTPQFPWKNDPYAATSSRP